MHVNSRESAMRRSEDVMDTVHHLKETEMGMQGAGDAEPLVCIRKVFPFYLEGGLPTAHVHQLFLNRIHDHKTMVTGDDTSGQVRKYPPPTPLRTWIE